MTLNGETCLVGGQVSNPIIDGTTQIAPTECLSRVNNAWQWSERDEYVLDILKGTIASAYVVDRTGKQCLVGGNRALNAVPGMDCFDLTVVNSAGTLGAFVAQEQFLRTGRYYHIGFSLTGSDPSYTPAVWCVGGGATKDATEDNTVECLNFANAWALQPNLNFVVRRTSPTLLNLDGWLCVAGGNPTDNTGLGTLRGIECINSARAAAVLRTNAGLGLGGALNTDRSVRFYQSPNLGFIDGRVGPSSYTINGKMCVAGGSDVPTEECYQPGGFHAEVVGTALQFTGTFAKTSTPLTVYRSWTGAFTLLGPL